MAQLTNPMQVNGNAGFRPMTAYVESNNLATASGVAGKKSFLVFTHNKYIVIPTHLVAFFYVKHDTTILVTFDKQEYFVNYSLDHIQEMISGKQFYRLNRQYLLNFDAVKEVEHYFARKLLVTPVVSFAEKLIVSKEKARHFLDWLENR
jgi:two-component system response regulator LytT